MNWVSQRTTSDYRAIVMTPKQAFEVLLNIPEPRRTLTLSDAATALRVSELLGLMWMDLDFEGLAIYVRRAYVWGRFKEPNRKRRRLLFPSIRSWLDSSSHGTKEQSTPRRATMCFPASS